MAKFGKNTFSRKPRGWYTRNGRKRPITWRNRVVVSRTLTEKDKRTIGSYTEIKKKPTPTIYIEKKPWEEGWREEFYRRGNCSLHLVKHEGILNYYIEVNKGEESFCCIMLRPLLTKWIPRGLQLMGIPAPDIESATEAIEKTTEFAEWIRSKFESA